VEKIEKEKTLQQFGSKQYQVQANAFNQGLDAAIAIIKESEG